MNRLTLPRASLVATGLLAAGLASAAPTTELRPGQPLTFQMPANALSNAFYIDVPAGAERMTVQLLGSNAAQDIDLLMRFDAPFPDTSDDGSGPQPDWLFDQSHYWSASNGGNERIVLTPASPQPLRSERLYLSLINFDGAPADATLSVTLGTANDFAPIQVLFDDTSDDCDIAGWNDASPRSPVRGNTGTTLGQQRRQALLEAARLLSEELRPNVTLRIQACWTAGEFGANGGTLAFAGPTGVTFKDPSLRRTWPWLDARNVVQSLAVSAQQGGVESCRFYFSGNCTQPVADVQATFNYAVDQAGASRQFDYGLSGTPTSSSFVSTAMHEISHGLGFYGLLDLEDGKAAQRIIFNGLPYDDAYGRHARFASSARPAVDLPLLRMLEQPRREAVASGQSLRFSGPKALQSAENPSLNFAPPDNYVRLHAPIDVSQGSSYSHLHAQQGANPQLMTASIHPSGPRTLGLAKAVMHDIGWDPAARAEPAAVEVLQTQYYDVARNGHGFDLRKVEGIPGVDDLYFVLMYTYDAAGRPEFFSANGRIVDGVFIPSRGAATGDSLQRNIYREGQTPSTIADPSPDFNGQLRIDFAGAATHPICLDRAPGRVLSGPLAVMAWTLDGVEKQWCVQPVIADTSGVEIDFSNQWFNPADGGWGMSILSFPGSAGDGLALELYFPDATGRGRWGLVSTADYQPGASYPIMQVGGYCRTCTTPAGEQQLTQIGTLSLDLREPGAGTSTVSIDLTYPGPEGGRFVRSDAPIVPVGTPGFRTR